LLENKQITVLLLSLSFHHIASLWLHIEFRQILLACC